MKKLHTEGRPESRETWLDGLRGFAACVVVVFHLSNVELPLLHRSYWAEPPEENRQWVQLPPFRLLTCGIAMSRLFFAVSGYSLSLGVSDASADRHSIHFYRRLTSSCLRRPFRLYIPVAIWKGFEHILWYTNLYAADLLGDSCPDARAWGAVWPHIQCWLLSVLDLMNCVQFRWNLALNVTLWTLPFELLGSYAAFVLLLGLAQAQPKVRVGGIGIVALYLLWYGDNELAALLGGLSVGELRQSRIHKHTDPSAKESNQQVGDDDDSKSAAVPLAILLIALYIMTLPFHDDYLASDWWFQECIQIPHWNSPPKYAVSWYAIGSVMAVAGIQDLEAVKAFLDASPLQFLGKISFSIYLVHLTVFHILRERILDTLCLMIRGLDYWQSKHYGISNKEFAVVWILTSSALAVVVILVAVCFAKWVERPSRRWAGQIEKWIGGA